ncbi:MAG: serine hydrolase [Rhizobiaceae bacterium]|nr:serine hydrolase [Rhizobiaceae bacterium]
MPEASDWSAEGLERLAAELSLGGSTAMAIVHRDQPVFAWGALAQPTSVASVRKSLINVLYGIYVAAGRIDLTASLAVMGVDDIGGLTETERSATVADLLRARSGVYHPSVYDTEHGRPKRGAYKPGEAWFYNNWDFNALGTIFERQTGEDLFEGFAKRVATPLGMQDFSVADCRYQHGPESQHPVYKMRLSARDLARIGLLYLRGGTWRETRIVSEEWVRDSVRPHSDLGGGRSYGLLWWSAEASAPGDALAIDVPIFYASGFGGQYIIVAPAYDLVVIHRAAQVDHGIRHDRMGELLRLAIAAMPEAA